MSSNYWETPLPDGLTLSTGELWLLLDPGTASDTEVVSVMLAPVWPRKPRTSNRRASTAHIHPLFASLPHRKCQRASTLGNQCPTGHTILLGMFQPWDVPSVLSAGTTGIRVLEGWAPLVVGTPGKSWQKKPQGILGNLLQSLPAPFHQVETPRSATKGVSIIFFSAHLGL